MTVWERLFVWGGGAAFVLTLAASTYFYFFVWASPAAAGGGWSSVSAVTIDAILLTIFALHHSLFARESIKSRMARVLPDRLLRSFYVWTASLLLLTVLALWQPVAGDLYHVTGWPALAHAAVQLAGVWLIARSVTTIDALELAGIKPASGNDALQVAGPYRLVRHPIYLGFVLALAGAAHMTANRLAFAAITTGYLLLAIPWEERSLLRVFGEPYARYQREVPWRVVPYVY